MKREVSDIVINRFSTAGLSLWIFHRCAVSKHAGIKLEEVQD